jgi:hypothetical protein
MAGVWLELRHPRGGGGLEVPHLWDETNREKAIILQASLQDKTLDIYHVMMGGIGKLQKWCCSTSTPLRETKNGLIKPPKKDWLPTLWEWLSEQDVTVGIPSIAIQPPYENDKGIIKRLESFSSGIMQVYTDHLRSNLEEDDMLNLQHIEEGQDVEVNTAV